MRISAKVTINTQGLQRKLERILDDYGPLISFQLQQEISTKQFEYTDDSGRPITTLRNNGQEVTSPRDIVDSGNLLTSQTNPDITSGAGFVRMQIRWTAPYSKAVLEGGYIVGTVRNNYTAKPRDWITPALQARPLLPFFVRRWKALDKQ